MASSIYPSNSLYYSTKQTSWYLDLWSPREIPQLSTDAPLVLNQNYQFKPDLLAYDLYGDTRLWWVFMMRNPDILNDPIYDMVPGITLMITAPGDLQNILNS